MNVNVGSFGKFWKFTYFPLEFLLDDLGVVTNDLGDLGVVSNCFPALVDFLP